MNVPVQNVETLLGSPIFSADMSLGGGRYSRTIADLIERRGVGSGTLGKSASPAQDAPIEERLSLSGVSFKKMISPISRYLDPGWRLTLIETLDRIFDPEDWDPEFALPKDYSFATFLRLILHLHPTKRPGIGLSSRGHILASWSRDRDRIVIECLERDELRWVLSQTNEGVRESAAGKNRIQRLVELIEGYEPDRFFKDGDKIIA